MRGSSEREPSYFKRCNKCKAKIHLRQMEHGQWVAFDGPEDVHRCPHRGVYDQLPLAHFSLGGSETASASFKESNTPRALDHTMSPIDEPRLFGKIGIIDVVLILLGGAIFANIATLFAMSPQSAVMIGYAAMLVGAFAARYGCVSAIRYIRSNFADHPKMATLIRAFYCVYGALLVVAWIASKIVLDDHLGR
jgi:hypothetical protein